MPWCAACRLDTREILGAEGVVVCDPAKVEVRVMKGEGAVGYGMPGFLTFPLPEGLRIVTAAGEMLTGSALVPGVRGYRPHADSCGVMGGDHA